MQTLSDDDPVALAVILNAIHLQTSKVPKTVTFKQLMKLAILCDKYDCVPAVKPWVDIWIAPWRRSYATVPAVTEWLFIAWVFEAREGFETLTKMYVPKIAFSNNGNKGEKSVVWASREGTSESWHQLSFDLYTPEAILGKSLLIPLRVLTILTAPIDAMIKQRENIVQSIIAICNATFSRYTSGRLQCHHASKDDKCDSLILGSLYKAFTKIGILSFDPNTVESRCLEQLVHELRGIKINHLDYDSWEQFNGCKRVEHSKSCDPLKQMQYDVAAQIKKVVPLSLESFKGKMKGKEGEGILWEVWEKEIGVGVSRDS